MQIKFSKTFHLNACHLTFFFFFFKTMRIPGCSTAWRWCTWFQSESSTNGRERSVMMSASEGDELGFRANTPDNILHLWSFCEGVCNLLAFYMSAFSSEDNTTNLLLNLNKGTIYTFLRGAFAQ